MGLTVRADGYIAECRYRSGNLYRDCRRYLFLLPFADNQCDRDVTENTISEYNAEIYGYNIKNRYTPKKTSVTVTKRWNDNNDQDGKRPNSVKVQLFGDGNKVGAEVELNEANNWTTTWNDLPEKKAGKTIVYTVEEVGTVKGYKTTVNNANHGNVMITNSHTPEKTEVSGIKTWKDANDQDGKRPASITVKTFKIEVQFLIVCL